MTENFATLAIIVFEQFKSNNAEIMHNDDSAVIYIPLDYRNEICIIFEDDDFGDYSRISVKYKILNTVNEVGVYSLIKSDDVEGALKTINKKVNIIKENYKVAKESLANLVDNLSPVAAEMLKIQL